MVISTFNPVHSIFWLIISFLSSALLLVQLQLDFIALLFIIVYVGAVAVLFLFVIMMLQTTPSEVETPTLYEFIPLGLVLVCLLLYKLISSLPHSEWSTSNSTQNFSLKNIVVIACTLYTEYQSIFILLSIILLLALIGAILLSHNLNKEIKRQSSFVQISRTTF